MSNYSSGILNVKIHKTRFDYCRMCLAAVKALSVPDGWYMYVTVVDDWALCHVPKTNCSGEVVIFIEDELWLLDENILKMIVSVFSHDKRIAMIGITGTQEIPTSGIAADSWEIIGETSVTSS